MPRPSHCIKEQSFCNRCVLLAEASRNEAHCAQCEHGVRFFKAMLNIILWDQFILSAQTNSDSIQSR